MEAIERNRLTGGRQMQLTDLRGAKSVDELAQRIYALPAGDKRVAAAAKAIAAANPHLVGDFGKLSTLTPVIIPSASGVAAPPAAPSGVPNSRLTDLTNQIAAAATRALGMLDGSTKDFGDRTAAIAQFRLARPADPKVQPVSKTARKLNAQQLKNLTKGIAVLQKPNTP
jgi:hypothetical protein